MELGLLGLGTAGKTTLFGALTGQSVAPGGDRQGRTAVVRVPDPRIDRLAGVFRPRKVTYAEVAFQDPPGDRLDAVAAGRAPLAEATANAMRNVDALVYVVRAFADPSIPRPRGSTHPAGDLETLEQELVLRDLALVEKRLERLRKEMSKPETAAERALLEQALAHLEAGRPLHELGWSDEQKARLRGFQFLSLKPSMVVLNVGEEELAGPAVAPPPGLEGRRVLPLCAKAEHEIAQLPPEEQQEFLAHLGLLAPARDVFLRSAYQLLQLVTFFTVGEDEVRAWPVRAGSSAWAAAGKIHSDIQRGFIRAETIHDDDFARVGSMQAARKQGLLRLEGKGYPVQDGDILNFRFSV